MAFDLINVFNITDGGQLQLDGAVNPIAAKVGKTNFLFVPGAEDDGLTVFKITAKGKLVAVDTVIDNGTLELDGVFGLAAAVVNKTPFLFAAATEDDGLSSFQVSPAGVLTNKDNVDDGDDLDFELDFARSVATAVVAGKTFVFVAGQNDNGVSVFQANNVGLLVSRDDVDDGDDAGLELSDVFALTTTTIGANTFLFAASIVDDGISVFSVSNDGELTNVDNVDDADDTDFLLDGARALTTAKVGDNTFLFTASSGDNGISVFDVAANGTLTNVDNVADNATLNLDGADGLTTVKIAGITYLFASGFGDDGFSAFVVAADGTLINVDNVTDDDNAQDFQLVDANGLVTAKIGKSFFLFVAGRQDDGVSVFKIQAAGLTINGSAGNDTIDALNSAPGQALASGLGDTIFGNLGNDTINGLGGKDIIDGGAGQDFYTGGKGGDRFVFAQETDTAVGATRDVIADFRQVQHDKINLKAIDANINAANDQAFHFIGHAQFSGKAGELRFAKHVVSGDTDGDGAADFQIGINGKVDLVKADFIL
jgi:6-phosphogluconolactonase (cycloisomerase 2 family)